MFWSALRGRTTARHAPKIMQTSDTAPTQSPDFVRTEFDDTVTELAAPIVAKIEETKEKDSSTKSVTIPIEIPRHHADIKPQTIAAAVARMARKRGISATFTMQAKELNFIFI